MFAHDARATALDLSRWIGPLSPAFAALAAGSESGGSGERGFGEAGPGDVRLKPDATKDTRDATQDTRDAKSAPGATSADVQPRAAATTAQNNAAAATAAGSGIDLAEVRTLFHTLNNQLGVILTYAELLEAKAGDEAQRKRAAQVVTATLEALGTTKALRTEIVKG